MCTHVSHDVTRVPTNGVTCHSWGVPLHPVHHIISLQNCGTLPPPYTTVMYKVIHHQSQLSLLQPHALHTHGPVRTPPQRHQVTTGLPQQPSTTIHHHTDHARPATNSTSNAAAYTKHHITVIKPYTTSQYTT
jgi:hypothetical protein